jgi:TP901 family phage tail tape measure protein
MPKNDVEFKVVLRGRAAEQYRRMSNSIRARNKQIKSSLNSVEKQSSKVSGAWKSLISIGAGFVGTALIFNKLRQAIEYITRSTIEFEKTLSKVKAIVEPTAADFIKLTNKARELGETTAFTASQAGQAFVEMGKLGQKTADIIKNSTAVLDLAALSQSELSAAAETTIKTMNQFNMVSEDSNHLVDVMAKSFTSSALDMNKFSESMKYVGTTASMVGVSVEETTAMLAVMADRGVEASMAGTSLNQAFIQLTNKSSKANKMFEKMGLESASFKEKLLALKESNIDVGEAFGLLDVRAARALNVIMNNIPNVERLTESFENADGAARKMADTMLDNVAGAITILKSAQEGLAIAIGESFGKDKQETIELYTDKIREATRIVKAHEEEITILGETWNHLKQGAMEQISGKVKDWVREFNEVRAGIKWTERGFYQLVEQGLKIGVVEKELNAFGITGETVREKINDLAKEMDEFYDKATVGYAELIKIEEKIIGLAAKPTGLPVRAGEITKFRKALEEGEPTAPGAGLGAGGPEEVEVEPPWLQAARAHLEASEEIAQREGEIVDEYIENVQRENEAFIDAYQERRKLREEEEARLESDAALKDQLTKDAISGIFQVGNALAKSSQQQKAIMIAQAVSSTFFAAQKQFEQASKLPPPVGLILPYVMAGIATAAGLARVAQIKSAATGADFITSGPQFIKVGDNPTRREHVQVTPLGSPNLRGPQRGVTIAGDVTINVSSPDPLLAGNTVQERLLALQKSNNEISVLDM